MEPPAYWNSDWRAKVGLYRRVASLVSKIDRVTCSVHVWLARLGHVRINRHELPRHRVVVAVNLIELSRPSRRIWEGPSGRAQVSHFDGLISKWDMTPMCRTGRSNSTRPLMFSTVPDGSP